MSHADSPATRPVPLRRRIRAAIRLAITVLAWSAAILAALTLVIRLVSGRAWELDLLITFAAPMTAAIALVAATTAILRRWTPAAILGAVALTHAAWLLVGRAPTTDQPPDVTVMTFNVRATNYDHDAILDLIRTEPADVIVLIECTYQLAERIEADADVTTRYPHTGLPDHGSQWNAAVLSKRPIEQLDLRDEPNHRRYRFQYAYQRAYAVTHDRGTFLLSALWLTSPRTAARWRGGNEKLELNAEIINRLLLPRGLPMVFAADLNASPPAFRSRRLRDLTGLTRGKPLAAPGTWPAANPPYARVAIDDVLVSPGVRVTEWRVVESPAGSDHLPVVVGLRFQTE